MPWYKVTVPSLADQNTLRNDFTNLHMANGARKGAALLFDEPPPNTNVFYFSPGAVAIAKDLIEGYNGIECPAPTSSLRLSLAAGDGGWESAIFPTC